MKQRFAILFLSLGLIAAIVSFSPRPAAHQPNAAQEKPRTSGAGKAMDAWWASRAYPSDHINMRAWSDAVAYHNAALSTQKTASTNWETLGPHNIGGRTLCIAFNPLRPSTMYAGSAAGGLWRSYTGGAGVLGWHRVATGFPVLGVAAIAVSPADTNTIYIGTGEVYNDRKTGNRVAIRTTRGSYGIGILKTTDGGLTWAKSLDWAYEDLKGVQDIVLNPANPSTVMAATSEGIYRSLDAGANWTLVNPVRMANDILYHSTDTTRVLVACGNLASPSRGVYRSTDGGATFINTGLSSFTGKITLATPSNGSDTVYASAADSITGNGVFMSTNFGQSWTPRSFTDYQMHQGWYSHDIAVSPFNSNKIFCVGIDTWMSNDALATISNTTVWYNWYLYSTPPIGGVEGEPDYVHADIHQVRWHPTDPNMAYFATDGGVFRTTDGGLTYEGVNGSYQTTQFYAEFSNSQQDSNLAIGGLQDNATAVYQGDLAWYRAIGGDGCCTAIAPDNHFTVYGSTQYGNIWISNDAGFSFSPLTNQPPQNEANFVTSFAMCESAPLTMYACTDYVAVTGDGGSFWSATNGGSPLNGNPVLRVAIASDDCGYVFASVRPGGLNRAEMYLTTDGGANWMNVTSNLPDRYYHEIAIHPTNHAIAYTVLGGFGSDHVYKTTNSGQTWSSVSNGIPDVPANTVVLDPLQPDHVYVGNDIGVYASMDGGLTWVPYGTGLPEAMIAMDLSISPSNRKLRVATHGNGVYQVDLPEISSNVPVAVPQAFTAALFPNPANTHGTLQVNLPRTTALTATLLDMGGKQLATLAAHRTFSQGTHNLELPVKALPAGTYFVALEGNGVRKVLRLLVNH